MCFGATWMLHEHFHDRLPFGLAVQNRAPANTTTDVWPDIAELGSFLEVTNLATKPDQFLAQFVIAPPGETQSPS